MTGIEKRKLGSILSHMVEEGVVRKQTLYWLVERRVQR